MGVRGWVRSKLSGWKEKFLSQTGREILIKAMIQAIFTYSMRVFLLPKTLCRDLNATMSKFWWGGKDDESKLAWMSWGRMGRPKNQGGMGFRDLESFNLAMLAKQGWCLLQHIDSLVSSFQGKVFSEYKLFGGRVGE